MFPFLFFASSFLFFILLGWAFGSISVLWLGQSCGQSGVGLFGVRKSFCPKCQPASAWLGISPFGPVYLCKQRHMACQMGSYECKKDQAQSLMGIFCPHFHFIQGAPPKLRCQRLRRPFSLALACSLTLPPLVMALSTFLYSRFLILPIPYFKEYASVGSSELVKYIIVKLNVLREPLLSVLADTATAVDRVKVFHVM